MPLRAGRCSNSEEIEPEICDEYERLASSSKLDFQIETTVSPGLRQDQTCLSLLCFGKPYTDDFCDASAVWLSLLTVGISALPQSYPKSTTSGYPNPEGNRK
jgi:hypothetical protein